jgi:hypothetical protein
MAAEELVDPLEMYVSRLQARTAYIAELAGTHAPTLRTAGVALDSSPETEAQMLFDTTARLTGTLERYAINPLPIIRQKNSHELTDDDLLHGLGWAQVEPRSPSATDNGGSMIEYVILPASDGVAVIDRLRSIMGEPSVGDQLAAIRSAWRRSIDAARAAIEFTS